MNFLSLGSRLYPPLLMQVGRPPRPESTDLPRKKEGELEKRMNVRT